MAERQGDLIEAGRDARIMVAVMLGGMLFVDLAADAFFGFGWRPLAFAMAQNLVILAFGVWLAGRLFDVRAETLTPNPVAITATTSHQSTELYF